MILGKGNGHVESIQRVHRPRLEVVIKKHFEVKLRSNPLLTLARYRLIGTWEDLIFLIKLVEWL